MAAPTRVDGIPAWSAAAPACAAASAEFLVEKDGSVMGSIGLAPVPPSSDGGPPALTFGRTADKCHCVLDHASVSRVHAAIVWGKGTLHLVDLGSANGTVVNGAKLAARAPQALADGDVVQFGLSTRRYTVGGTAAASAEGAAALAAVMPPPAQRAAAAAATQALPTAFGTAASDAAAKRGLDGAEAAAHGASKRRRVEREAEIAAMTASMLAAPPAPAAGAAAAAADSDSDSDSDDGPRPPSAAQAAAAAAETAADAAAAAEAAAARLTGLGIPVSHEVVLGGSDGGGLDDMGGGGRTVLSLASDASGARVLVAGADGRIRMYDWGGMDRRHRPFRSLEAEEGHAPTCVAYSATGDRFLICTGSATPVVCDRDGQTLCKFVRGDMYLHDSAQTKGHTQTVSMGAWHPRAKNTVLTCGADGTLRVWDLLGERGLSDLLKNAHVIKVKNAKGLRADPTCCAWHPTGKAIAAGTVDGDLLLWKPPEGAGGGQGTEMHTGKSSAHLAPGQARVHLPIQMARGAHAGEVTAVAFSPDKKTFASRGEDGAVKLWNYRDMDSGPLKVLQGLGSARRACGSLAFSPDALTVCVGVAAFDRGDGDGPGAKASGRLHFYRCGANGDAATATVGVCANATVTEVVWHARTKQLLAACSDGAVRVFYDPLISEKGALLSTAKAAKRTTVMDLHLAGAAGGALPSAGQIITPYALPMYKDEAKTKNQRYAETRRDPVKSKQPARMHNGPMVVGAAAAPSGFTEHFLRTHVLDKKNNLDSREALQQYAGAAGDNEYHTANDGVSGNQLAATTLEQEEAEWYDKQKKILDT